MSAQQRYWLLRSRPHFEPSDALELYFAPAESLPDAGEGAIFRVSGRRLQVWGIGSVNAVEQQKDGRVVVRASVPQDGLLMEPVVADPQGHFLELLQNDPEMQAIDMEMADRIFQTLNARRGQSASWLYGESPAPEPESNVGAAQQKGSFSEGPSPASEPKTKNRRPGVLHLGDTGPNVVRLQRALSAAGYRVLEDGVFGPTTDRAVRAIQAAAGEEPDGFASAETVALYEQTIATRAQTAQQQTARQETKDGDTILPDQSTGDGQPDRSRSMADEVRRLNESFALAPDVSDILSAAAELGLSHGWSSLSSSLILFGLMDRVQASDPMFPIVEVLRGEPGSEVERQVRAVREEYLATHTRATGTSPAVPYLFQYAGVISHDTAPPSATPEIGIRHLVCSLIAVEFEDGGLGARRRLRQMGHDPSDLASRFVACVADAYPSDNHDAWLRHMGAISRPIQPAFDSDGRWRGDEPLISNDRLGIAPDVSAFAKLIAATTVEPPLSIGLFGDWGSGKTFFMRCLQEAVSDLARKARDSDQPQNQLPYFKHIVQIEFNAWHYVESNLWASLVEHILENLCVSPEERQGNAVEARQEFYIRKLKEYEGALRMAEQSRDIAAVEMKDAEMSLQAIRKEQETAAITLAGFVKAAKNVTVDLPLSPELDAKVKGILEEAGIHEVDDAVGRLEAALKAHQEPLERGNALLTGILKEEHWVRHGLILVGIILATPALAWLISQIADGHDWLAQLASVSAAVAGFIGVVTDRVKKASAWVKAGVDKAEKAAAWKQRAELAWQELQREARKRSSDLSEKITRQEQELEKLKTDYAAAQDRVQRAREKVVEAERAVREHSPAAILGRYIQERTASDDYRKHLGILALIRRDFEQLSNLIEAQNRCLVSTEDVPGEVIAEDVRINRIVLYIDDLDRCPSDRVAEVMQAVHLLLAFPLFVVVVGVDARWLSRSLSRRYRGLLRGNARHTAAGHVDEARATPFDYLEKIFQIPLWLSPLDQVGTVSMVDALLKRSLVSSEGHGDGAASQPEQVVAETHLPESDDSSDAGDGAASDGAADAGDGAASGAIASADGSGTGTRAEPASPAEEGEQGVESDALSESDESAMAETATLHRVAPPLDLSPHSLEIHPNELEFMRALAPIIGRSPRAVKRFVNTYRLIKASLPPARRELFVAERGAESTYQHVMLLLAVVTGLPELSPQFFTELVVEDPDRARTVGSVVEALRAPSKVEWRRLDRWMASRPAWRDLQAHVPARQAAYVARYSFRVSRLGE